MSRGSLLYVALVGISGVSALVEGAHGLAQAPPATGWLALAVLTWISGAFAVKLPSVTATISVSEVFVFALVLLFGSPAAMITVALDGLASSILRGNRQPRRLLFNVAEPALSIWVASHLYYAAGGPPPLSGAEAPLTTLVGPVLVLAVAYLMMNTWLTAAAVGLESGTSVFVVWRGHIVWMSVNFIGGASIALLLAVNMRQVSVQGLLLILPLVLILYLVFRNWTERIRDADTHVAAVDRLFFSTVEAFATAIESKDEVTHDHVRRVKTLSLAMARHMGVTDALQLRAIEAGALLHDIGKVAIPDHILDKPDKLTSAEYELMKLHAPIGAEILATIEFPYPVVPIVRHHHESWDGTGYPDRIAGDAIPMGARIISVVDVFDALTSDRPYRRALTEAAALDIIKADRGTKHDPVVVDALIATHEALSALSRAPVATREVSTLIRRLNDTRVAPAPATPVGRAANALAVAPESISARSALLDRLWPVLAVGRLASPANQDVALALAASVLRASTPAVTVLVGTVNRAKQVVDLLHASGHGEQILRRECIRLGEGVVGWVSVNGRAIVNADAALDFPDALEGLSPQLRSALAVPLGAGGVLALYSDRPDAFGPQDRIVVDAVAERLSAWLTDSTPQDDSSTLPFGQSMPALLQSLGTGRPLGILSLVATCRATDDPQDEHALAAIVLPALRLSDGLFVASPGEIVAVLQGCEAEAEALILSRVQRALDEPSCALLSIDVGFAVTPRDGPSAEEALRVARRTRMTMGRQAVDHHPVGALAASARRDAS